MKHLCNHGQVGFDSRDSVIRCSIISALILVAYIILRANGVQSCWLYPFSSAISVLGANVHFLSLLIMTSHSFTFANGKSRFYTMNFIMLMMLVTSQLAGLILGLESITNVSRTYWCIWILFQYSDFHLRLKFNGWILMLLLSMFVWRVSLWLHMHPKFIISLFTMSENVKWKYYDGL